MSHKYDGKLTDRLIQTVVDAENRLNGLMAHPSDATGDSTSEGYGEPISQPGVTASRMSELADYQKRVSPADTERAEAWRRSHCDYEPEE